jgi:hypothetical protein
MTLHRIFALVALITALLAGMVVSPAPAMATAIGNHNVTYVGYLNNYPAAGQSTWFYTVTSGSGPALSHITFSFGGCLVYVGAGTWTGDPTAQPPTVSLNAGGGSPVFGLDPTTGVTGVKFDQGFNGGQTRNYYFTVSGAVTEGSILVAAKAGPGFTTGNVTGPGCDAGALQINAQPFCDNDTPKVNYAVTTNLINPGLATIEWVGSDNQVAQTLTNQPLSGTLLWAGAAVDGLGNPIAWPGWELQGSTWVFVGSTVRPQATLRITVNPTAQILLDYPPGTPLCRTDPPEDTLSVLLAGFDATAQGDHIEVAWQTVSEANNAGFNLYRSLSADGELALLSFTPSAAPGSTQGAAYNVQDFEVIDGQVYWYYLEDVDLSGATTLHGPVSAMLQAPTAVTLSQLHASSNSATTPLGMILAGLIALALAAVAGVALARRQRVGRFA